MGNNKGITREHFEKKGCEKIFQQQTGRNEAKKELKIENHNYRKKGILLKFMEEEQKLKNEFASEFEIKSKFDKELEAKIAETIKRRV